MCFMREVRLAEPFSLRKGKQTHKRTKCVWSRGSAFRPSWIKVLNYSHAKAKKRYCISQI
ncbi:hypothetical protein GBA52_000660 [Prunus armeniaca]|nr:hypothetical protein GBA52_000660 [Prunus armeniaca]